MDKSWIKEKNKFSNTYVNGVQSFIAFVKKNMNGLDSLVKCPCCSCNNAYYKTIDEIEYDLKVHGICHTYVDWIFHGETIPPSYEDNNDVETMNDSSGTDSKISDEGDDLSEFLNEMREAQQFDNSDGEESECFCKLLRNAQCELYPGCKVSLLSTIVKLLHLKVLGKWSNKSFNMLLEFLKSILPVGERLPSSLYGARKLLVEIGLGYEEIDACKNDCALFWKENENKETCPVCKESRWKTSNGKTKKIPHKKLRYFPLKPRLQRLYMSSKTPSKMLWHKDRRVNEEGITRHPADSLAWKHLDNQFPHFAHDPRNVRLGLACDGFTPWSNLGNSYSMWPVILAVYNLPPYECMRSSFLMMSLLIPGPSSPGKDIDVYLQPLIEELKELWNTGVETYDICKKEKFQMHAAVLWTISDLPGYSVLSGWVTMGHYACPCCLDETDSKQLRTKTCYMGHRRFLHKRHLFPKNKRDFNGEEEHKDKPRQLSGGDILGWLNRLQQVFSEPGKHQTINRKRKRGVDQVNWVKRSIFFELPYWDKLLIRHNLDVMHIEKNICDNVLGTILDIKGKTKDPFVAREDLRDWGIREELHVQIRARDNKPIKPPACFTLSTTESNEFCRFLKSVKFPDGYAANISKCVRENKITGLKAHDCHILLQRLIPTGIRGYLTKEVNEVLYELRDFFKKLCSKTLTAANLEKLEKNIPIIMCKLEKIFPPYFFTIMVHLTIHLAQEAIIGGPVQFRWMYPVERFLSTLKGFVGNRACPEGSICQGFIVRKSLIFLSLYLPGIETIFNRPKRNFDGSHDQGDEELSVFTMNTRTFGKLKANCSLSEEELNKAHWYILSNCEEVEPYLKMHKAELLGIRIEEVDENVEHDKRQNSQFPAWFRDHVNELHLMNSDDTSAELWALANGPLTLNTSCYDGCIVNEVRFHTKSRDEHRKTQNSGLVVQGNHKNQSIEYFGFLRRVVELVYIGGYKVVLFECEWFDMGSRKTTHADNHFISIDTRSRWYKEDPFVLPVQVQQVFYLNDTKLGKDWQVVQRVKHRHLWDLPELEIENISDAMNSGSQEHSRQVLQQYDSDGVCLVVEPNDNQHHQTQLSRDDVEPEEVDRSIFQNARNYRPRDDASFIDEAEDAWEEDMCEIEEEEGSDEGEEGSDEGEDDEAHFEEEDADSDED